MLCAQVIGALMMFVERLYDGFHGCQSGAAYSSLCSLEGRLKYIEAPKWGLVYS